MRKGTGMKDKHDLSGRVTICLREPGGHVVEVRRFDNLITTAGRMLLAKLFTGALQTPNLKIAVGGKDDPAAAATDVDLRARLDAAEATVPGLEQMEEEGEQRVVATISATLPATGAASPQEIREAGIELSFAGAEPVLYNHVTFPVISRAGNLEMTLTWEVIF